MKRVTPKRWISVLLSLSILLVVVALVCISFGASPIPIRQVVGALRDPERLGKVGTILWEIRLPRVLMGAIVGAALASAGVVFQALLRNPLADPYVLGVSGGGAVGAIVAMMLGTSMRFLGFSTITVFAFSGSLLTILLVYAIGQSKGRIVTHSMLLAGVIVNSLFSAIIMFLTATMD
ncbi:MAG: iron chelate uptake ABC transporter family permease subunit, partial [Candidatus Latescibacteria bacterium]|nr:iron chelate uptake ABC transporter family permease subunit [Candidatus Latescibacterota bacterium]